MKKIAMLAVIACLIFPGCGKSEQASATDTAVTETVEPASVTETSAAGEGAGTTSEGASTDGQEGTENTSTTGQDSGPN